MARGLPAVWSALLGLPIIGSGAFIYLRGPQFLQTLGVSASLLQDPQSLRLLGGLSFLGFGFFIFLIGLYIQFISPPEPTLHENEQIREIRHPSQRVAISKIVLSIPLIAVTGYLLLFTLVPYMYPTATFIIGLYFFSIGLRTYWANTLTTYYVTTARVISEYRFLSLRRKELPLEKLRGVEENKSVLETLVGLGNIRVASGGGGGSVELVIRNIGNSTSFANEIRNLRR